MQTGKPADPSVAATTSSGVGLVRPLEAAARKANVQILLKHKMASLVRQGTTSGKVLGIKATSEGKTLNIARAKAVILATGGSSNNVNFRRIFDVRLTEEYNGVAGEPYSFQDASGELAGIAIGASLWGAYNQVGEFGERLTKAGRIGTRYGYRNLEWQPGSPVFHLVRASGLTVRDYQNVILVNQAGARFYDETAGQYTANNYHGVASYKPGSYLNAKNIKYDPANFLDAALAGTGEAVNGGGPIWAIFDADAAKRGAVDGCASARGSRRVFFLGKHAGRIGGRHCESNISASRYLALPSKARSRATTLLWMRGTTPTSGSPLPSTKFRRRRSTRPGPCP